MYRMFEDGFFFTYSLTLLFGGATILIVLNVMEWLSRELVKRKERKDADNS